MFRNHVVHLILVFFLGCEQGSEDLYTQHVSYHVIAPCILSTCSCDVSAPSVLMVFLLLMPDHLSGTGESPQSSFLRLQRRRRVLVAKIDVRIILNDFERAAMSSSVIQATRQRRRFLRLIERETERQSETERKRNKREESRGRGEHPSLIHTAWKINSVHSKAHYRNT